MLRQSTAKKILHLLCELQEDAGESRKGEEHYYMPNECFLPNASGNSERTRRTIHSKYINKIKGNRGTLPGAV